MQDGVREVPNKDSGCSPAHSELQQRVRGKLNYCDTLCAETDSFARSVSKSSELEREILFSKHDLLQVHCFCRNRVRSSVDRDELRVHGSAQTGRLPASSESLEGENIKGRATTEEDTKHRRGESLFQMKYPFVSFKSPS